MKSVFINMRFQNTIIINKQTLVFTDAFKSCPDTVIRVHPIGHYSENIYVCTFSI